MPSSMNDRIAFSTEHFTVHCLDDPERPYRIDNGAGSTRLGEPACVTIRINHSREGRQAARIGDDYLESLGIER